jgi:hypothetical protein
MTTCVALRFKALRTTGGKTPRGVKFTFSSGQEALQE